MPAEPLQNVLPLTSGFSRAVLREVVRARPQPAGGDLVAVKRDIGNLAAADLGQITRAVKRKLKQIQHRPELVDGCLAETRLIMDG